ncbi:aromatic ring-hydroxylating oxygenase subunit alpha [Mycolicibacterium hodleri]|uniref:aromatic ring-hydroxylating oxygenase subunit alpha n=1 Tax=Mycolicibacterium hodleri TaxID=49897 RepID=UPI001F1AE4E1|nr:aromatic ring-hydroxylating dioxygenase subunit alpha [Mycolicibacterium hodleri]
MVPPEQSTALVPSSTAAQASPLSSATVRDDFVPKEAYFSPEYLRLEKDLLWPRVWQVACRVEEIPNTGDFVTYEVADESIIVSRLDSDTIVAYYNVCQHRGRKLTEGCGNAKNFFCRFHGWRWDLDGSPREVVDRDDYGAVLQDRDIRLKDVKCDTWGGFVFVTMEADPVPLREYLDPVPDIFDNYDFDQMRYRWSKTVVLPCNWKVALEAFNEGYHVQATHPQLLRYNDDWTVSESFGKHSMFTYPPDNRPLGFPSRRLGGDVPDDLRGGLIDFMKMMEQDLRAIYSTRDVEAAQRLLSDVPEGTEPTNVLMQLMSFQRDAAIEDGAGWPDGLTFENIVRAGIDWHMFPNLIVLPYMDGSLWYRARPNGDDPDSCIFDVWSLARYAPGAEPVLNREFYSDWRDHDDWGRILPQDFQNMDAVQQGMKSRGFAGSRTNPIQEKPISNFHRVLHEYLGTAKSQGAAHE